MKLDTLIEGLELVSLKGSRDVEITAVNFDSREIIPGAMFVAVRGVELDGHKYISKAIENGAVAIVCEELPENPMEDIVWILVKNARNAIAWISAAWYGHPSRELKLIGVTGTNGKTTIVTLLYKVHTALGYKAGILSTIEVVINEVAHPATHTTPDPMQINAWIRKMVDAGCDYCFMEVSSHAASQQRIFGLDFDGGVFTNLTHDHLDYHKDFRTYLEAKKSFFELLDKKAFALVNDDDKNGRVMIQSCSAEKHHYSLGKMAEFRGKIQEMLFEGTHMEINERDLWVRLTGRFNASNILAVYGTSILLGHDEDQLMEALSIAESAEGRFDIVRGAEGSVAVIDYAHTDDALKNVLETLIEINSEGRQLITVVGAGGDRDKTKRPEMGAVAASLSSKVIFTSDNPRSENPSEIMNEMEKGVPAERLRDVLKIVDREEAIKTACMLAEGGLILIAGKGHEKYQVIGSEKRPFDDKVIVNKYLM